MKNNITRIAFLLLFAIATTLNASATNFFTDVMVVGNNNNDEIENGTCADSLIRVGKNCRLADFKYCVTKKTSTLASELEHGFKQAETVILKLEHIDTGLFNEAIDYLVRNEIPYGNILLKQIRESPSHHIQRH